MKKWFKIIFLTVLILAAGLSFAACVSSSAENNPSKDGSSDLPSESENLGDKVFYATVTALTTDFGGILVEPESDTLPNELVVHAEKLPSLSVGDRVKIQHDGQIALSYPGQIFGAVVTLAT
ncbi:MAG: hypothetical protein J6V50_01090 [Clostridia bacterium]|nr:hypothetical protein [Clostridia bacterium]